MLVMRADAPVVGGDLLQPPTIWFLACVVGRVAGINGDIPCIGVRTVNV